MENPAEKEGELKRDLSDPLDDFSRVSDEAIEKRIILKVLFGSGIFLCLWFFVNVTGNYLGSDDRSGFPPLAIFLGILTTIFYIALVRIDSGRWAILHPRIVSGFHKLWRQRGFLLLLIALDLIFAFIVVYPQWSGMKEYSHGWLNVAVIVGAEIVINLIALSFFSADAPD